MSDDTRRATPPTPDPAPDGTDWEGRWQSGDTPWDLGRAPPSLEQTLAQLGSTPLDVAVPGAGRAHDALAFAAAGHRVTAIDIAPSALAAAATQAEALDLPLTLLEADWLDPSAHAPATFDLVWEQTCYCAIPPARRADYARTLARVLRPGGRYVGLFWQHGREGGPPYHVTPAAVASDIGPWFEIEIIEVLAAEDSLRGDEFLLTAVRKAQEDGA